MGESNEFFIRLLRKAHELGIGAKPEGRYAKIVRSTKYMVPKGGTATEALQELTDEAMAALKRHYAGRIFVGAENGYRLAGLYE